MWAITSIARKGGGTWSGTRASAVWSVRLPHNDRERFKRAHLKEIEVLTTNDGIWLDVGVLYGVGTKPT